MEHTRSFNGDFASAYVAWQTNRGWSANQQHLTTAPL